MGGVEDAATFSSLKSTQRPPCRMYGQYASEEDGGQHANHVLELFTLAMWKGTKCAHALTAEGQCCIEIPGTTK